MKQEMTIEELKFAREIGATNCWNGEYWKSGTKNCASVFMNGEWVDELGRSDPDGCFAELWKDSKIDFAPLDEYEAAQEVPEGYYLDDESGKLKPLKPKADMVNHPPHYQSDNGIECIDAIRAALGKEGFIAYCRGNAMKYIWRDKSDNVEDWKKAAWYLNKAAEEASK